MNLLSKDKNERDFLDIAYLIILATLICYGLLTLLMKFAAFTFHILR